MAALSLLWPSGTPDAPPLRPAIEHSAKLDALIAAARRKRSLRAAVADDLIAGRTTLAAAVTRCEEIEAEFPELAGEFRAYLETFKYPGRPFNECLARNLLANCSVRLEGEPGRAATILPRLKAELVEFLQTAE